MIPEKDKTLGEKSETALRIFRERFPQARIDLVGSLRCDLEKRGRTKGTDIDIHISGLNLENSNGGETIRPLPQLLGTIAFAGLLTGAEIDVFVTHENKLWSMRQSGLLSRRNGALKTGQPKPWTAVENEFYSDLNTIRQLM